VTTRHSFDRRSFAFGAMCALTLAAGVAVMTGAQRTQRPNQEEAPPTYYVTSAEGNSAQLWRLPAESERLEYVGVFAAVNRGGR